MKFKKYGKDWELPEAFYRVAAKLIIKDENNKVLVLKDLTTDAWEMPGGGVDHGEDIKQAIGREVSEELGVELTHIDNDPFTIEFGLHPDNYRTVKIYFQAKISSSDFKLEEKFKSKFVDKQEFMSLHMFGDESPIQKHANRIWPS